MLKMMLAIPKKAWEGLCNHPLVGEAKIVGMMAQ